MVASHLTTKRRRECLGVRALQGDVLTDTLVTAHLVSVKSTSSPVDVLTG